MINGFFRLGGALMDKFAPAKHRLKNGAEIVVRHLVAEDAAAVLKFRAQVPHDSTHTMQYVGMVFPSEEETAKRLTAQAEDPLALNIAAFDQKKMIGTLNFRLPNGEHPWTRHLGQFGMMILKEYWGQGIGRILLDAQDTHARKIGVSRIEAMVRVQNERE